MKKATVLILGVFLFSFGIIQGAEKKEAKYDKFYGKITSINLESNKMDVFNKSKKLKESFQLKPETRVYQSKKTVLNTQLVIGQNLIVHYAEENNQKIAKKITIRSKKESPSK